MTPERLKELRDYYTKQRVLSPPEQDIVDILIHLGLVETELNLHKMSTRSLQAIAWDTGAHAGLDWDKSYPDDIRNSNPFKENK